MGNATGGSLYSRDRTNDTVLYVLPGSQFVSKVLTALDALEFPYRVVEVQTSRMKDDLEPPHSVPQMKWKDGSLITDSSDILKALDQDGSGAFKLYPEGKAAEVEELEQQIGTVLNAHVLYFTWWVEEGYKASYERKIREQVLFPALFMPGDQVTGRMRGSYRKKARAVVGEELIPPGREPGPDEEANMKASLLKEVRTFEACFSSEGQPFLFPGATPTAADFALYGILERLVGDEGDGDMGTATPWLFAEANVPRLQAWHTRMRDKYPIQFLGKGDKCKVWKSNWSKL